MTDWLCLREGVAMMLILRMEARMTRTIYVNGSFKRDEEAAVNVLDHGLLYGDGIFEGIRAYNGRVFKLDRHLERLFESAKALRIDIPATPAGIERIVLDACRRNQIVDGYVRVLVTRGIGDLGIDPRSCGQPQIIFKKT
jgi:branched-chain amino acid aminotransferase